MLTGSLTMDNAGYTNVLLEDAGSNLNATLPQARLSSSSLRVSITANLKVTSSPPGVCRIRCLIDGQEITNGTGKALEGRIELSDTDDTSFALVALLPPGILPAAAAHVIQPQVYTLESQINFDSDAGEGGFWLVVEEIVA
jgi:hypothetical protein